MPPEFRLIQIGSVENLHRIRVIVSDYNSYRDIFRVEVEILDHELQRITHVFFRQYESNETRERFPTFVEPDQPILVRDRSLVSYAAEPVTVPERTEMEITFVLTPVQGRWLRVTAVDLAGLTALAEVEYVTGTIGRQWVDPVVLVGASVFVALVIVGVAQRRERLGG